MSPEYAALLLDLLAEEFKRGGITEAHIIAEGAHVHGLCEGEKIVVNPAPAIVDTLLHELLHRRFPKWGEKRVERTATRLVYYMDSKTVRHWHRKYQRAAKKAKRPVQAD